MLLLAIYADAATQMLGDIAERGDDPASRVGLVRRCAIGLATVAVDKAIAARLALAEPAAA